MIFARNAFRIRVYDSCMTYDSSLILPAQSIFIVLCKIPNVTSDYELIDWDYIVLCEHGIRRVHCVPDVGMIKEI